MNNKFVIAIVISVIYTCIKYIEMRLVDSEPKPLKTLARDAILVYFSVILSFFIIEQVIPLTHSGGTIVPTNQTPVFTDNPGF